MDHIATSETVPSLLAGRVRDLQHRPLLTAYDESTGARTELSYATAANWAAKTANLLVEELGVEPGMTATLDLDGHWTTVPLALASWQAGIAVAPNGTGAPDHLTFCHTSRLDDHPAGAVVAVGDGMRAEPLDPVAQRDGLVLLGEDVWVFADDFDDAGVSPDTPALATARTVLDHMALLEHAAWFAGALDGSDRVGLSVPLDGAAALVALAGVVTAGGSVVVSRPPGEQRWNRWAAERVTAVIDAGDGGDARRHGLRFVAATALDPDARR